jgi:hypothetical protein
MLAGFDQNAALVVKQGAFEETECAGFLNSYNMATLPPCTV